MICISLVIFKWSYFQLTYTSTKIVDNSLNDKWYESDKYYFNNDFNTSVSKEWYFDWHGLAHSPHFNTSTEQELMYWDTFIYLIKQQLPNLPFIVFRKNMTRTLKCPPLLFTQSSHIVTHYLLVSFAAMTLEQYNMPFIFYPLC